MVSVGLEKVPARIAVRRTRFDLQSNATPGRSFLDDELDIGIVSQIIVKLDLLKRAILVFDQLTDKIDPVTAGRLRTFPPGCHTGSSLGKPGGTMLLHRSVCRILEQDVLNESGQGFEFLVTHQFASILQRRMGGGQHHLLDHCLPPYHRCRGSLQVAAQPRPASLVQRGFVKQDEDD
jgi:hypothetical protein